jgi:hypothetical protein
MNVGEIIKELPKEAKLVSKEDTRLFTDDEFMYTRYWKKGSPFGAFEYRKFEDVSDAENFLKEKCPTWEERNRKEVLEGRKKATKAKIELAKESTK